ncbi:FRG domain-containing protein [Enterococcus avium]
MLEFEKSLKDNDIVINVDKVAWEQIAEEQLSTCSISDKNIKEKIIIELGKQLYEEFKKKKGKAHVVNQISFEKRKKAIRDKLDVNESLVSFHGEGSNANIDYFYSKDLDVRIISSVQDAINLLDSKTLDFNPLEINQSGVKYFFRGHEQDSFKCIPSVLRNKNYFENEDELYIELQTLSPRNFANKSKHLEILTEMQHYSLPTRLLDITTNPLAALFFSVFSTDPISYFFDGEVIVLKTEKNSIKNFSSDIIELQTSLAFLSKEKKARIKEQAVKYKSSTIKDGRITKFNENDCVKQLIHEASKSGILFQNEIDPKHLFEIYLCLPLKNNERISSQSGAFLSYGFLNSRKNENDFYNKSEEDYLRKLKGLFYNSSKGKVRFIIPFQLKEEILAKLDDLGINQGNIYPDIEKRSGYIKGKYLSI